ncbi:MAG: beta-galactosidase, partial [Stomatobaculum sp.]|nr:beta-galactosidase [Stomatobaculum sp.]
EKPLLLVEYCHSMGNSPGDFKEYRDLTEAYPRLCGGFVWEWCDHAVYKGIAENRKPMYWYGGDHGELQHDGNFCLDGLVYPDRRPHTGLLEYKNVHRPFRADFDAAAGCLVIRNHLDFLDPGGRVKACWRLTADGETADAGEFLLPSITPHGKGRVPLVPKVPDRGHCFLQIDYIADSSFAGFRAGDALGSDEIVIRTGDDRNGKVLSLFPEEDGAREFAPEGAQEEKPRHARPEVREEDTSLIISGDGFEYRMDTLSGLFTSFRAGGREFLKAPADFNLWRAPTDNDRPVEERWKLERLDHTVTRAYEVTYEEAGDAVRLKVRQSTAAMSVQPILRTAAEYLIRSDGSIFMQAEVKKDPQIGTLPRLGLRFFLDLALDQAEYFGIGPWESYVDKCRAGHHGRFTASLEELQEDYIRPQENGSRCGCDYVRLTGEDIAFTAASADGEPFSFNASVYTQEELEQKRHNYELEPCGSTVLCIDHRMAGIGSKSCGPDLSEQYRIDEDTYRFAFLIRPERV